MKLHLPKLLLTAVMAVVMAMPSQAALTVTDNGNGTTTVSGPDNWSATYNSIHTPTSATDLPSAEVDAVIVTSGALGADTLSYTNLNKAKNIVVGGTGQLYLQTWNKGAISLNSNLVFDRDSLSNQGLVLKEHDGNIDLNGTVTLLSDLYVWMEGKKTDRTITFHKAVSGAGHTLKTSCLKYTTFAGDVTLGGLITTKEAAIGENANQVNDMTFKGNVSIGTLTVQAGTTLTFNGENKKVSLGSVAGNGSDLTLNVGANVEMALGSTLKFGTLVNNGNLVVEDWSGFDYTWSGGEDATDNGLVDITKTYQILSGSATLSADPDSATFTYGDQSYNIADGYTIKEGSAYVIAKDTATVDLTDTDSDAAKADRFLLKGGTLNLAAGTLSKEIVTYTGGSVNLAEGSSYTGLDSVTDAELIGSIGGEGTIEVTGKSDYSATFNPSSDFTGTVYVKSGNFTYDGSSFGKTLKLAQGVNFQVNAASTLAADETLTLESGTHEVHVNDRADNKFTILGTVNGDGTLKHLGTKKAVCIEGNAVVNKFDNNQGDLYVQGAATVNYLTASGGTTNVSGGSVTTLSVTGGTTNVSGGSVTTLSVTGGTTNVSGGTLGHLNATGGTTNLTGTASFAESTIIMSNNNGDRYSGIYAKGCTVNIGNGTDACTITVPRVEMSDGADATLNLKQNATMVVTMGDASGSQAYWRHGFLLGAWNGNTTMNVEGTLLVQNAHIAHGDNTGIVKIKNGGIVATKGMYGAQNHGTAKADGRLNLNLEDGGKLILGEGGIDVSNMNAVLGAGTIGISADATIAENLALSSETGTTFDTQKYVWGEGGASIAQGTDGGTLRISGVISDHSVTTTEGEGDSATTTTTNYPGKLVKAGAGTLELSGDNTYSGGTDINAGTVKTGHTSALGEGAVSVAEGASLELGASLTVSDLTIDEGGSLIFGNGTKLTVTGTLTLDASAISFAKDITFSSADAVTLATAGTLAVTGVDSWKGEYTIGDKAYTAGLSAVNNVLSLTFEEVVTPENPSITTTLPTKVTDVLGYENGMLTLQVEGLLTDSTMAVVDILGDPSTDALMAKVLGLVGDTKAVAITLEGTLGGELVADAFDKVVFVNEKGEGYYGEMVGGQLMYNVDCIPEPASATLSLAALMMLCARRRRQK